MLKVTSDFTTPFLNASSTVIKCFTLEYMPVVNSQHDLFDRQNTIIMASQITNLAKLFYKFRQRQKFHCDLYNGLGTYIYNGNVVPNHYI